MGWGQRRFTQDGDVGSTAGDGGICSTRKVVRSQCKTEEVEPGKFIRKCEKTEEVLRECIGKPTEVLQSNREYTEDDVTEEMVRGNSIMGSPEKGLFEFPGLRSDIEALERRFFDSAEEMRSSLFDAFGDLYNRESSSSPSRRQDIPIEGRSEKDGSSKPSETRSGEVDLSALARDV